MNWFKSASLLVTLLVATPAFAQLRPPVAPSPLRGYLIGGGGASIATNSSLTLNAEIAENMTRNLQAYMSVGYYDNIMSDAARNQLQLVGSALTSITGTPWLFSGRDRGLSFTFGAKVLVPGSAAVHPYVGGGFGALNLQRTIHEVSRGNITERVSRGIRFRRRRRRCHRHRYDSTRWLKSPSASARWSGRRTSTLVIGTARPFTT